MFFVVVDKETLLYSLSFIGDNYKDGDIRLLSIVCKKEFTTFYNGIEQVIYNKDSNLWKNDERNFLISFPLLLKQVQETSYHDIYLEVKKHPNIMNLTLHVGLNYLKPIPIIFAY